MRNWNLALLALVLSVFSAHALEIQGINLPDTKTVAGKTLQLNGAGVRTVKLAIIPIKAYVASFYAPSPLRTASAVMSSSGPLQLNFTFLAGASAGQVSDAWKAQFAASTTFTYKGFEADRDQFIAFYPALSKGDTQTVVLNGGQTEAWFNGKKLGTIPGTNFQKAFLSLWFGSNPVQDDLKTALLGQ
jgi:hypothetical protein